MDKTKGESGSRSPKQPFKSEPSTSSDDHPFVLDENHLACARREFVQNANEMSCFYDVADTSKRFALGMLMAGAKEDTLAALAKALNLPEGAKASSVSFQETTAQLKAQEKHDLVELSVANKVFIDKSLEVQPSYQNLLKESFQASPQKVQFIEMDVVGKINSWVKTATLNKIAEIVEDPLDADSGIVLVNIRYTKIGVGDALKDCNDCTVCTAKSKLETTYDMHESICQLGLEEIFRESVNLAGISETGKLHVDKATQKVLIEATGEYFLVCAATALCCVVSKEQAAPQPTATSEND